MGGIAFKTIWDNYPDGSPCADIRGKVPAGFDNQCAVRVGLALEKSGVSFKSFKGGRCPLGPKDGGMVAGAQALANWLAPSRVSGMGAPERYKGADVQIAFDKIADRTGIIFIANYWKRATDTGSARTGDHIDLWNGSRMTAWTSYLRVHLGISWDGLWSDYMGASEIIFWPIP
jgi:hypothetical protein